MRVTIHEAKTNLSKLIRQMEAGEEVIIQRGQTPVARLAPVGETRPKRQFGTLKGIISIDDRFFEPLPEEELAAWEGGSED